jgi:hypothetical protein
MLWLLDMMVEYPKARIQVHISKSCVALIRTIVETREKLISSVGLSVKVCMLAFSPRNLMG